MNISVVIPAFNSESTIATAIQSILKQKLPVSEILIIDDGSKDSTKKVVNSFSGDLIKYHYQENSGPSKARNRGIQLAQSEWIAFLDSDDLWKEDHTDNFRRVITSNPELNWYCAAYEIQDGKSVRVKTIPTINTTFLQFFTELTNYNFINTSGVIVKKKIFEEVGYFNENWSFGEDLNLWFRIALIHPRIGYDQSIGNIVRRTQKSITYDKSNYNLFQSVRVIYVTEQTLVKNSSIEARDLINRWINDLVYSALILNQKKILFFIHRNWLNRCSTKNMILVLMGKCLPEVILGRIIYIAIKIKPFFKK